MQAGKVGGAPGSGRQNGRSFHKRMEEWVGLLLERVPRARSEWAGDGRSFVRSGRGFERALTRYWELQSQLGPAPALVLESGCPGSQWELRRRKAGVC